MKVPAGSNYTALILLPSILNKRKNSYIRKPSKLIA